MTREWVVEWLNMTCGEHVWIEQLGMIFYIRRGE